ncbi:MAG: CsgG/HfaB family protein, partial [Bryobacteraceae bacterium]|nr:CsgG/HfaB family protein [Bryobacteraceae bacterium]
MRMKWTQLLAAGAMAAWSQTPAPKNPAPAPAAAKPAAAKPAAPKPAAPKPAVAARAAAAKSPVDLVIDLVKAGMSENLIIKQLRGQNKAIVLAAADMLKLKQAGVSEQVIEVMMDPAAAPQTAVAAAAPSPTPEAAPAAPAAPNPATPVSGAVDAATASTAAPNNPSGPVPAAQKPRVIVDEFDYSAVATAVQQVFHTNQNIGKGIRAMLVKRVAEHGNLVVVERAKINTLQAEQDRNASNRVRQGSGARIGRITGANLLVAGDIIIFGRDDKQTKVRGGGIIGSTIGAIGARKNEDKAVVAINYRVVDAETSEVVATGEARGESVRKSKGGFGAFASAFGKGMAGVEVDMNSSGFAETIIGEATMDCVNKLAKFIEEQSVAMKKTVREVEALVADVNGSSLTISAGGGDGVNQGEVFEVHKILREVKDPV